MRKKVFYAAFAVAILGLATWSYQSFDAKRKYNKLFYENVEALTEPEASGNFKWSTDIDCPGLFTGDYQVCEMNGPQSPCSTPGYKTCECNKNCD